MNNINNECINAIRILSAEAIQKANSGHPGLPMGSAPMAFELWANHMKHNPAKPDWFNRDRFVLSAGHGSMLVYSLLHLFGYGLTIDDLKEFRQYGSKTPGHPEFGHTTGVETTTGPLGQGFANSVGFAMAESYLSKIFNKPGYEIINHYSYTLCGDGCMMEGITSEAASLAGTLGLGKLIALYDDNNISIEGCTDIAFRENVGKRFEAYGWQVLNVEDGNDTEKIAKALIEARKCSDKPSLIIVKTLIGYGCPTKQGKPSAHGEPLGDENILLTKEYLKWQGNSSFDVPSKIYDHMSTVKNKLAKYSSEWDELFTQYSNKYPELAKKLTSWIDNNMGLELLEDDEYWAYDSKPEATRSLSEIALNKVSAKIENLIGGSADLSPSNKTIMKNRGHFTTEDHSGSNLHFGVREHAMASIANGLSIHGGLLPYVATFFVFSDYMKGAMRLSSIMKIPVIYVLTHDSIGVGEDGPTHEPIEQLAALRSIPGFTVFRPCDATETSAGWYCAISNKNGPTALILTRQKLQQIKGSSKEALKGAYVISKSENDVPDAILIATGSEVSPACNAQEILKTKGFDVSVVSMPSWELFEKQTAEYKESVLPSSVRKRVAVEAGCSMGWHKYTGMDGAIISIDTFGVSGPYDILFEKYGFTAENIANKALELLR